jgi:hypothetical protein
MQIAGMQAAIRESVQTIQEISATVNLISEISSTITAAVEELRCCHAGNLAQRPTCGLAQQSGCEQHYGRQPWRGRDRISLQPGPIIGADAVKGKHAAEERRRKVSADGAALRGEIGRTADLHHRRVHEMIGVELGYSYAGSNLIAFEPDNISEWDTTKYLPHTRPGVRIPHMWLKDGRAMQDVLGDNYTCSI